jgi:hypothetical protein
MSFRIKGLSPDPFRDLYGLADEGLARRGAIRCIADAKPGFPDRIELRDAEPGESLILLNYVHQPAATPYQASHAIFVREGALQAYDALDEIPTALRIRPISLRAFDARHMMLDAALCDGMELEAVIKRLLSRGEIDYLHAQYAKAGCYAGRIERA